MERAGSTLEQTCPLIRVADVHVFLNTTCGGWLYSARAVSAKSRRPGQTATPVGGVGQLISAHQVVHKAAGITKERFSFAEWQFIDGVDHQDVVANEIVGSICHRMTNRVVVAIVGIGASVGVVRNKLKTLVEALIHLHLQGVVVSAGVIAVVIP